MRGTMMEYPLTLQQLLFRNQRLFGNKQVISRTADGIHRYSYGEYGERVARLANALRRLDVGAGDRVATLAWNTYRHLELYYAVPCMGAVLHTVNIRLSPEQIAYIINDAGDSVLAIDRELLPLLDAVRPQLTTVKRVIVMGGNEGGHDYEELLAEASPEFAWPEIDERDAAGICYSSGTTGSPKGVVYSHRAVYLHSMGLATVDSLALSEGDRVLPVVPMFHVNAWGLPHASVGLGAELIMPGPAPTPKDILELIQDEAATVAAGVPTVWLAALDVARGGGYDLSSLREMVCGGSAAPQSLIEAWEKEIGVPFLHAWGMTETAPVATVCRVKTSLQDVDDDEMYAIKAKQGLPVLGVDLSIVDDAGQELPWDGTTSGEIVVRGPWVTAGYFHDDAPDRFIDGWFRTGDVATIDANGYVRIVDRTKDLVKSGGEWISSVELENAIMGLPAVAEAAVIAVPNARWGERPLALVVRRPGADLTEEEVLEHLRGRVARFAVPDTVEFVDEIPKTGVGKFDKKKLRQVYAQTPGPAMSAPRGEKG